MGSVHDVVVVGAGPAGASAAWRLSAAGLDVLLVERSQFPRDKVCGDGLTPWALGWLDEMGVLPVVQQAGIAVDGLELRYGQRQLRYRWGGAADHALVVPRRDLDQILVSHAEEAGALFAPGWETDAPIVEGGTVKGLLLRGEDGRSRKVGAKIVIGADGARSPVGTALGMVQPSTRMNAFALSATVDCSEQLRALVVQPGVDRAPVASDRGAMAGFCYGWVFPLPGRRLNIGVGALPGAAAPRRNLGRLFDDFVRGLPSSWQLPAPTALRRDGRIRGGQLPLARAGTSLVRGNVMLVGDAAGMVDPFTGEGISGALRSGVLAGHHAQQALGQGSTSDFQAYAADLLRGERLYTATMARLVRGLADHPRSSVRLQDLLLRQRVTSTAFRGALLPVWNRQFGPAKHQGSVRCGSGAATPTRSPR